MFTYLTDHTNSISKLIEYNKSIRQLNVFLTQLCQLSIFHLLHTFNYPNDKCIKGEKYIATFCIDQVKVR